MCFQKLGITSGKNLVRIGLSFTFQGLWHMSFSYPADWLFNTVVLILVCCNPPLELKRVISPLSGVTQKWVPQWRHSDCKAAGLQQHLNIPMELYSLSEGAGDSQSPPKASSALVQPAVRAHFWFAFGAPNHGISQTGSGLWLQITAHYSGG